MTEKCRLLCQFVGLDYSQRGLDFVRELNLNLTSMIRLIQVVSDFLR